MSALQLFKHTKSTHPPLLPHFPSVIAEMNKMQPFYLRRLSRHNVNTFYVLCCKFAYQIKIGKRRQKN